MGKSKRKRKLKEEDFKKKKLKVGKRLPMPDNVTKTSFKARSINILQQNPNQDVGEPTNVKRQTLKDLLGSCSHYNTQAREEALLGLKDLIEKHSNVLKDNLNEILQRILGKITDLESSVRRALLSLIRSIFTALPGSQVAPFFPSVVAYLCSAMSHLNEGVRLDSMKLLDLCLQFHPQLLRAHSKNIILNFINIISTEKGDQYTAKTLGVPNALSLKAKMTSQKTQLEVLTRLNWLLTVIFHVNHESDGGADKEPYGTSLDYSASSGKSTIGTNTFLGGNTTLGSKGNISYGTINPNYNATTSRAPVRASTIYGAFTSDATLVSDFSLKSVSGGSEDLYASPGGLLGNEVKLMEFIASLSPVLFEYWVECCPSEFAMNLIPVKKTYTSLLIMKEVLEIFVTLVKSLEKIVSDQGVFLKFLEEKLFCSFYNHFVSVFPMRFTMQHPGKKGKKDESKSSTYISDVSLNILICELLCYFIPETKQDANGPPKWVRQVVNYLSKILVVRAKGSSSQSVVTLGDIKHLTELVKCLVLNLPVGYDDLKNELLKSMYQLFEATHAMSNTKKVLLQFLQEAIKCLAHREISLETKATLDMWTCALVKVLNNKDLDSTVVRSIFSIFKVGILQRFTNIETTVRDALPGCFKAGTFTKFEEKTQLLLVEILYHLKHSPTKQLFEVLSVLCSSGTLSLTVFQYLVQVLHQVLHPDTCDYLNVPIVAEYHSFILSLLAGQSQKQLATFQNQKECFDTFYHPVNQENILVAEPKVNYCSSKEGNEGVEILKKEWEYQKSMTTIICKYLILSEYSKNLLEIITPCLNKLFGQYTTLPLPTVYRLLFLVRTVLCLAKGIHIGRKGQSQDMLIYTAKWCAVVWHFVVAVNLESKHQEFFKIIQQDLKEVVSELCRASSSTLQIVLDMFLLYTSATENNCTLTCGVLTDMLKAPLKALGNVCQTSLKNLYRNLENNFDAGMVDSQVFSDFKYHSLHSLS